MDPTQAPILEDTPAAAAAAIEPDAVSSKPSLLRNLLDRRIPQVAGVYLGTVWTLSRFVSWLVDRFVLSPYLEDLFMLTALLLTPLVFMLAYGHGAKGKNRWSRAEKIFIPCNVTLALVVLFLIFNGKDLGSARETVTVVDTEGNQTERVVPKSEFRKRVAAFAFDNATGDPDQEWTRHALPSLLANDLLQDLYLTVAEPLIYLEDMRKAGFEDGLGLPLALQHQIARDKQMDYVVNGTLRKTGETLTLETNLYQSKSGKRVAQRSFEGPELLALVDEASVQLKHDLEIPNQHIEDAVDLPVAEVTSSVPTALRAYQEAMIAGWFKNDFATAASLLDQALADDPTFANAYVLRSGLLQLQQNLGGAAEAFRAALQHSYRMPERLRFIVNTQLFFLERKPDEALQTVLQWHALYPDDTAALGFLAQLYHVRGETDEAVAALEKLAALEPDVPNYPLQIGDWLRDDERFDEAREAYLAYTERFPDRADGHRSLGHLYADQGEVEQARASYRQAMVLEPDNPSNNLSLAGTQRLLGDFDEAYQQYQLAVERSRTPSEKTNAYAGLASYYGMRGQNEKALATYDTIWTLMATYRPEIDVLRDKAAKAGQLAHDGRVDVAQKILEEARAHPAASSEGLFSIIIDFYESDFLTETGRAEEALTILEGIQPKLEAFGMLGLVTTVEQFRGEAYASLGRFEEAAAAYETFLKERPSNEGTWKRLGQVYHQMGQYDEARQHLEQALKFYPAYPEAHLAMAQLLNDQQRYDEAREHLDRALAAWADADADHPEAQEAQALLKALP